MKEIPVFIKSTKDTVYALVDDDDYEKLSEFEWVGFYSKPNNSNLQIRMRKIRAISIYQAVYLINKIPVPKDYVIDHINGDRIDNRKENLRVCTQQENTWNRGKVLNPATGTSYIGVTKAGHGRKGYRAYIKDKDLGCYLTPVEAAWVRDQVAKEVYGEYARLNNVPEPTEPILTLGQKRKLKQTSKYRGVVFDKRSRRWGGVLKDKKTRNNIYLGYFPTELEAAQRVKQHAQVHPEFSHYLQSLKDVPESEGKLLTLGENRKLKQTSQIQGVYFNKQKQKWCAEIGRNGRTEYLGCFPTERQAAQARKGAEKERAQELARLKCFAKPDQNESKMNGEDGAKKNFNTTWKRPHIAPVWNVCQALRISHTNLRRWLESGKLTKWTLLKKHRGEAIKGLDISELAYLLSKTPRDIQRKLLNAGVMVVQYRDKS